jgi:hypothetical protein
MLIVSTIIKLIPHQSVRIYLPILLFYTRGLIANNICQQNLSVLIICKRFGMRTSFVTKKKLLEKLILSPFPPGAGLFPAAFNGAFPNSPGLNFNERGSKLARGKNA